MKFFRDRDLDEIVESALGVLEGVFAIVVFGLIGGLIGLGVGALLGASGYARWACVGGGTVLLASLVTLTSWIAHREPER